MSGLLKLIVDIIQAVELIDSIYEAGTLNPRAIVNEAYDETKDTIVEMCVNEGQLAVIERDGIEAFREAKEAALENDFEWEDVDLGDYMTFVGEIVAEGNMIMSDACQQAQELQEQIEEMIFDALTGPR